MSKNIFFKFFSEVVNGNNCIGCGACVAACPFERLTMKEEKPEQISGPPNTCPISEKIGCGICSKVCPVFNKINNQKGKKEEDINYGNVKKFYVVRSRVKKVLEVCQDGGVVSTILLWGLKNRVWSQALVCGTNKKWAPYPFFAKEEHEIFSAAGSRYTFVPSLSIIDKNVNNSQMALVGLPCHINGMHLMKNLNIIKSGICKLSIGLFCSGTFSYNGLLEELIQKELKIPLEEIKKMNIKGSFSIELFSGEIIEIPLKKLGPYRRKVCLKCNDFAAINADISVGGLGLQGRSLIAIRTLEANKIIDDMRKGGLLEVEGIDNYPKVIPLLNKLALKKQSVI